MSKRVTDKIIARTITQGGAPSPMCPHFVHFNTGGGSGVRNESAGACHWENKLPAILGMMWDQVSSPLAGTR
jgi:hypothetical protein